MTILISLLTKPRPRGELAGLVYSEPPREADVAVHWWQRPLVLGSGVLLLTLVLNLIFF